MSKAKAFTTGEAIRFYPVSTSARHMSADSWRDGVYIEPSADYGKGWHVVRAESGYNAIGEVRIVPSRRLRKAKR